MNEADKKFGNLQWRDLYEQYQEQLRGAFSANKYVLSGFVQMRRKYRDEGSDVGPDVVERIEDMIELGDLIVKILGYDPDARKP